MEMTGRAPAAPRRRRWPWVVLVAVLSVCKPGREVEGQLLPRAAGAHHVQDRVDDVASRMLSRAVHRCSALAAAARSTPTGHRSGPRGNGAVATHDHYGRSQLRRGAETPPIMKSLKRAQPMPWLSIGPMTARAASAGCAGVWVASRTTVPAGRASTAARQASILSLHQARTRRRRQTTRQDHRPLRPRRPALHRRTRRHGPRRPRRRTAVPGPHRRRGEELRRDRLQRVLRLDQDLHRPTPLRRYLTTDLPCPDRCDSIREPMFRPVLDGLCYCVHEG
jgi:hypothetical protein